MVSITVFLSPLLQKLWLNIFLDGFNNGLNNISPGYQILFVSNNLVNVSINYSNLKLSICCATSQLLLYVAVIGRIQTYNIIVLSFIYIVFWNLNYFLCVYLLKLSPDSRFFDDYSISMVYVFGGFVALLASFDSNSRLIIKKVKHSTKIYSKITSFIGIFFIWLSFCCTFSIFGTK